uniref:Uncharacterized protein n=1 Tax=Glycine max TaxID=3847 RepID=K7LKQ1_SOYBN
MKERRRDLASENLRRARRGGRRERRRSGEEQRDGGAWVWSHRKKERSAAGSELRGLRERMERMRGRVRCGMKDSSFSDSTPPPFFFFF